MQLNAIYLQLLPLPYQLDAEAGKFLDRLLPELLDLLDKNPDSKIALTLGGFELEKLILRKRTVWLEKITKLVGSQLELLAFPFYDISAGLVSFSRLSQQLDYQQDFWKQFGTTPAKCLGVLKDWNLDSELLKNLHDRGIKSAVIDSRNLKNKTALSTTPEEILISPATVLDFSTGDKFFDRMEMFALSAKVQLRSVCLVPSLFNEQSADGILSYLSSLMTAQAQGFLLPSEFAFPESAKEMAVFTGSPVSKSANYSRVESIWQKCHEAPAVIEARAERARKENRRGERHGAPDKFDQAMRYLHQASSRELDLQNNLKAERSNTELALYSVVELEAYLHPDIDPTIGWVERETTDDHELFSTQLADYILDKQGRMLTLDYKPRKCALVSSYLPPSFDLTFTIPTEAISKSKTALTRKTKDLCSIRFEETRKAEFGEFGVFRELTFRAGVGAHLPNSTTGFSFEYWLEGDFPEDLFVKTAFSFCLPSPGMEAGLIKPLLCVGGVSERRYYLETAKQVDLKELTGGAYGVRIIDSVEDLTMDLRSAKQLENVTIMPNNAGGIYLGSTVTVSVNASRINGDDKSNTLFFSIV